MVNIFHKSIGARLAGGFGVILVAMVVMGSTALVEMAAIKQHLNEIVDDNNRKTELLNALSESVHIVSRVSRSMVLLHDTAGIEHEKARIDAARQAYEQAEAALDKMPSNPDGLALRSKIKAAKAVAQPFADQVLELALAGRDAEATAVLMQKMNPADLAWQHALDASLAYERDNTERDRNTTVQAYERTRTVLLEEGGVVLLLAAGLATWIILSITRPLQEARNTMGRMRDEGDLTGRARILGRDEIGQMSHAFNALIERFQTIVGEVQGNANQVSSAASQLAISSAQLAEVATSQSEAAVATAAGVEQMAVSVASVADSAEDVRKISNKSLGQTDKGCRGLSDMAARFSELEADVEAIASAVRQFVESTHAITAMTQQVGAIADQTNLLALNAAIEAARAGEHGRGFAVVADEVRKLAEQSRRHAGEIDAVTQQLGQQSGQLGETLERGLESLRGSHASMGSVRSALTEMGDTAAAANRGVDEITASVQEQKSVTGDIARNMERIAQMSEESDAAVHESAKAAQHIERLAANLRTAVAGFRA